MFLFHKPVPELAPYIQGIMVAQEKQDKPLAVPLYKPFPPAPEQILYFFPRKKILRKDKGEQTMVPFSIVSGPTTARVDLAISDDHLMIGVIFKAGGLHALLGMPMTEFLDNPVDCSLIWPKEIRELEHQMTEAGHHGKMIRLIETFLLKNYSRPGIKNIPLDKVLNLMTAFFSDEKLPTVDQLANLACLSTRQFDRKFYERIGISPKLFLRLARFSKACHIKDAAPDENWLTIALQSGYYDLQHMLRDFKNFAGTTPSIFLQQDSVTPVKLYTYKTLIKNV